MVCGPTVRVDVLTVATLPLRGTGEPKLEPSTWNCTKPPGVPRPVIGVVTVAVKVTGWFKNEGLAEAVRVVLVRAWVTCTSCENSEVLPSGAVAVALIHWPRLAGAGLEAVKLALPLASVVTVVRPRQVCPSPYPEGSGVELE